MKEPRGSSARSRCARSGIMRPSFIARSTRRRQHVEGRAFLGDAAEEMLVALVACGRALRIDPRLAARELLAQPVELHTPAREHGAPVAILTRLAAATLL